MSEELEMLRGIAQNPYDRGRLGVYADWLDEHGREEEAGQVRKSVHLKPPHPPNANWLTNGELIGILLQWPLDAVVIYDCCSDYATMEPDHVTLVRAEDRKIIFREQNGYSNYKPEWFETDEQAAERVRKDQEEYTRLVPGSRYRIQPNNKYVGEQPDFRTVVHFPGN